MYPIAGFMIRTSIPVRPACFIPRHASLLLAQERVLCQVPSRWNHALAHAFLASDFLERERTEADLVSLVPEPFVKKREETAFAVRPAVVHRRLQPRQILPHFPGHCAVRALRAHQTRRFGANGRG